jgi:hypothetical protein
MTWHDVTTLYILATSVMTALCFLAFVVNRAALDVFAAAGVVFIFTVISEQIVSLFAPPWSSAHMPVQDVICAAVATWSWRRTRRRWAFGLAAAFTVQCAVHVVYWGAIFVISALAALGVTDDVSIRPLIRLYPWPINALFLVELAILSTAGGGYVAGYVRGRLSLLSGMFVAPGSQSWRAR